MKHKLISLTILFMVCLGVCSDTSNQMIKILFIGNSYTHCNDMPVMLSKMGDDLGYEIKYDFSAPNGVSFADHKNDPETLKKIKFKQWDYVVLQNQSQLPGHKPADVRIQSLSDAKILVEQIINNNPATKIIYYATWGRLAGDKQNCRYYPKVCTFAGHTSALKEGYDIYENATGGLIAPVGTNWKYIVEDSEANRPFGKYGLWYEDGSHPNLLGSYLAAATILRQITNAPVSSTSYRADLDPEVADYILSVVDLMAKP